MKNVNSTFQKIILPVILILSIVNILPALTCTFTNGGGDNIWHNTANWDAGVIPDSDDDAIVNNATLNITSSIDVNSLSINGSSVVTFSHNGISYIGDLAVSGGSLTSGNKIRISDSFNWTGTSTITTSTSIELESSCVSSISGTGNRNLYGVLINEGTLTHTGATLRLQTGGNLENNGTYTFDGTSSIIGVSGDAFANNGIVNKNNTNELNFFATLDQFHGTININAGTLKLLWGGSSSGNSSINIASDAILNFNSGTYTFGGNSAISGSGNIEYSGATVSYTKDFNLSGETKISGGTINLNQSTASFEKLSISGGTLQGSSDVFVSNQMSWSGTSTISISGSLNIENTATMSIFNSGSKSLYTSFVNEGTINHTGGDLRFYSGGSLENNGTYTLSSVTNIYDNGGGSFDNNGILDQQTNNTLNVYPDFNNNINGSIQGQGTINFSNLTNLGIFIADATSGTLNLNGTFDKITGLDIGFVNADHGQVIANNNLLLSGDLDVTASGTPGSGTYTILSTTSGAISGTFDNVYLPAGFSIQYTSTEVNLLSGVLPVELTRFDVLARPNDVYLHWQTTSEINSDIFIIEHSQDARHFIPLGEIKAVGNSTSIQNYQFVHETPANGFNYYRLRQQDIDGSFEYSDLRVLSFYNFNKDLSIYPNPTLGNVFIKNQSDKEFKLTITDLNGKIVYVRKGITPGATALDLHNLPKAMYTLEFSDDGFYSHKEKLMILE